MFNVIKFASLALIKLYAVVPALAHGWVTIPPSRQARCAAGEVPNCGDVQFEPQSVEADAGSFLCNGEGRRFNELNDDALWEPYFFQVAPGVESIPFTWSLTVGHRTTSWEYFVLTEDNALLLAVDGNNETVPLLVTHLVPLGGFSGRQTVLARWTIGDTPNAFYACVDLLITPLATATAFAGAAATKQPVSIPLGLPELGFGTPANGSDTDATRTSVSKAVHNLFLAQGPHS